MMFLICKKLKKQYKVNQSILGPGHVNHLSTKLINYLQENEKNKKKLLHKYNNEILMFDSIFESGNLLQAEMVNPTEYQLYMQVDTNTRGHQQWFYFRVRNTKKDRKYTFKIMNFTKSGLTLMQNNNAQANAEKATIISQNTGVTSNSAGGGLQQPSQAEGKPFKRSGGDHLQKIHYKSKLTSETEWHTIDSDQLEFVKTNVQRRRKDILAAAADSEQEDMMEDDGGGGHLDSQKLLKQKSPKKKKPQFFYALQFEVQFSHSNDSVYFAYAIPYTLSDMTEKILMKEAQLSVKEEEEVKQRTEGESESSNQADTLYNPSTVKQQVQGTQGGTPSWQENTVIISNEAKCIYYKREIMARSICGLPLYHITIGRDSKSIRKKPVVIITSRVHAAETPSSFVFDGIYNFLCSNASEAKFLRRFYTFVLVPTLNPDGIVCGNYRSSTSGVDLNRQWIQPDEEFQPEIYSVKQLLKNMSEKERRQLWIYCDLHGHSKKKNSFFYGCNTAANGGFLSWTIVRLLPRIFAQKTHLFNYKDCRFKVEPYKLGTGRVVAWKQFMITHSFTLESSFYGYDFGEDEHRHFTHKEYAEVGVKFCNSIYELHFLWKSIRNELKLTNGWLKPRKLIEITGVPAAQLLSEELQKKKKEEQKKRSIEQYEQFLKRFFNKTDFHVSGLQPPGPATGAQSQPQRRGSKLVSQQPIATTVNMSSLLFGASQTSTKPRPSIKNAPLELGKSRNNGVDLIQGGTTGAIDKSSAPINRELPDSPEKIYQLLQGLVKIQALIRGYLTRKRARSMMPRIRIQRTLQPHQDLEDDIPFLRPTNPNILNQQDLNGIPSLTVGDKLKLSTGDLNWRNYFKDQELETAYHHVEIEKEDDPDDTLSNGSSSNPSQDNFDLQEMYEQIYQIPKVDARELTKRKREDRNRFFQEINDQDFIDQQSMFQILDGAFKGKRGQIVRNTVNTMKSKIFRHGKGNRNELKMTGTSVQVSPDKALQRRPSLEARELTSVKKSDNMSPIMRQHNTRNEDLLHPIKSYNLVENLRIDKNLTSQTRLQTGNPQKYQHQPLNQGVLNPNLQNMQYKLESKSNQIGVLHSTQFHGYGKKESIQQVIKDCFITKKIGGGSTGQNPSSTQANFFAVGGNGPVAARVHSLNSQKQQQQPQQVSNTIQHIKKQQIQRKSSSNAGGSSTAYHAGKTPAQRLQEQRDQIRHYFKQHGVQQPGGPGSSYEKHRALVVNNGLIGEQSIPMHHYGGEVPLHQDLVGSSQTRLDPGSLTTYGGGIFGGPNSLSTGFPHDPSTTSSLFMKYVKQKLIKKPKVETIPQQVTDKYIDIYKELIEQEAQKKQEEQEFIRKHQSYGFSGAMIPSSFGATGMIPNNNGIVLPTSVIHIPGQFANNINNSRNTQNMQSRSEQKSRQRMDKKHISTHQTHTSRKEAFQNQPLVIPHPQQLLYQDDQNYSFSQIKTLAKPRGIDEIAIVRTSVDVSSTTGQPYNILNESGYGNLKIAFSKGANQNNELRVSSQNQKLVSSYIESNEHVNEDINLRFPHINSQLINIDKKGQIQQQVAQSQANQDQLSSLYSIHSRQNQNGSFFQGTNKNLSQSFNYHQSPTKQHPPLTNSMIQQHSNQKPIGLLPMEPSQRRVYPPQHDSMIDSSVDEDMLDKIKNIYSEMRMHNPSSITVVKQPLKRGLIIKGSANSPGQQQQHPQQIYYPYQQRTTTEPIGGNGNAQRNPSGMRTGQSISSSGMINSKNIASTSDRRLQ